MRVDCTGGSGPQWVALYDGAELIGWWAAPLDLGALEQGVTVTTWARCVSLGVPSDPIYLHEPAGMILGGVVDLVLALAVLCLFVLRRQARARALARARARRRAR